MRFDTLKSALAAAAVAAAFAPAAWPQDGGVKRIVPGGPDGDRTYYSVVCRNGTHGSVAVLHDEVRVCATPQGGRERCSKGWALQEAAEHSCKSKKSG